MCTKGQGIKKKSKGLELGYTEGTKRENSR